MVCIPKESGEDFVSNTSISTKFENEKSVDCGSSEGSKYWDINSFVGGSNLKSGNTDWSSSKIPWIS